MRVLAGLDGTLLDPEAPLLRADDLGVLRGDGVFETVLVVDGRPRELEAHLDRLARSAAMLDLPEPDRVAWRRCARAVIDAWPVGEEMALKLVYTRGPEFGDGSTTAYAMGLPISESTRRQRVEGVSALTLERGFAPEHAERAPWLLLGAKSLSYAVNMAALRHAQANGADEVIFVAADGSVLEGPTSTVVVVRERTLRTTPPSSGVLPGTTQAALFRGAERAGWTTKVEPLRAADLWEADAVFLASSVRRVTRVHTLDGEALPRPERARELQAVLNDLYEAEYL
ncbi:4-amino-4-deoxychorismate lyase [Streptoalloteichus tenebrarius]|uniref:4-amino-4-deoxychorismate lyase n=1 Tax=Streptoalloteichus tenebrarius (strain ATCC 17920 / DSM 40477 / JCM 4838 / CBS 697.72 / NBRC 16177 / NCIMB 11028 / NRRL B-12390 / A12253. 1 / ISP 5477) TaxID=1933 RepID=A0ABT1HV30_STRSD|nr:aminodeoxychorismate lyase [Streptoalloteichus tenebrarius]MCP2259376.1 4-amino-4-deoxychorismate lyase [Streptoalloteichus tenebrarius]BFF02317.1 aminodeoxychorismate lyase [Streptoalloteichus tenebrarius]